MFMVGACKGGGINVLTTSIKQIWLCLTDFCEFVRVHSLEEERVN